MKKRLLLIEDDQYSAQSFAEQLSEFYDVSTCNLGDTGFQEIVQTLPDIILLDIMLPGKMNGFDVLREVKLKPATAKIPVVMLTNLDDQKKAALAEGAVDCLVKANTDFEQIHTVIEGALNTAPQAQGATS